MEFGLLKHNGLSPVIFYYLYNHMGNVVIIKKN
jgi:hypothetical protein